MNKEESINKLKEFHLLINNYFDGKYENDLVDFKELKNVKNIKKCKIEYTDKITFKWLYDNVPLKIWLTFFSLLIGTFLLGYQTHNFFDKSNIQNINILKK